VRRDAASGPAGPLKPPDNASSPADTRIVHGRHDFGPRRWGPRTSWALLCPRVLLPLRCASIAEASLEAGSLQAVYDRLDAERAAKAAAAAARRNLLAEAVRAAAWRAEGQRRYQAWRATPLVIPPAEPWPPEPAAWSEPPCDCAGCTHLFGPDAKEGTCGWSKCGECAALRRFMEGRRP
jgi:hypothetical protein